MKGSTLKLSPEIESKIYIDFMEKREIKIKEIHLVYTLDDNRNFKYIDYFKKTINNIYECNKAKKPSLTKLGDQSNSHNSLYRSFSIVTEDKVYKIILVIFVDPLNRTFTLDSSRI